MYKLIIYGFIFSCFRLNAQYKVFPKLEKFYNQGEYAKCIENADEVLLEKKNNGELYPYVWQLKSYLALDNLASFSIKKNALEKAFKLALKLNKKDKEEKLTEIIEDDIKTIIKKELNIAKILCESNASKATEIYTKLLELSDLNSIKYAQYKCLKSQNSYGVETLLKNIVISNYQQFKSNAKIFENLDTAYSDLILVYLGINKPNLAYEVYAKAKEVYPKSNVYKQVFHTFINLKIDNINNYSLENEIFILIKQIEHFDSVMPSIFYKKNIHTLNGLLFKNILIEKNINEATLKKYCNQYLNYFTLGKLDSLAKIMIEKLNETTIKDQTFNQWIVLQQHIKKHAKPIDAIKDIHTLLIEKKMYDLDFEFLHYCKLKFSSNKLELQTLSTVLNNLISKQISNPNNKDIKLMDKYALTINSKELKDKQYQLYFSILIKLLAEKKYSAFSVNCKKALVFFPNDVKILALKKQFIIEDYKASLLSLNKYEGYENFFEKTENLTKCETGIVNQLGHNAVLQTINYVRRLANISDSCVLDPEINKKCQKAALMMSANNDLSHSPPKKWKCYTADGANAAGNSNLSLGRAFHHSILGQMEDFGENNYSCGHRRWLLNPYNSVFGHGSTLNASCITVFGYSGIKIINYFDNKQGVMWPSEDYFPLQLVPARWSFSLSNADFKNCKITILENGKPLKINIEKQVQGYGLNTIVWTYDKAVKENMTYSVTISNIEKEDGYDSIKRETKTKIVSYTYKVIPISIK